MCVSLGWPMWAKVLVQGAMLWLCRTICYTTYVLGCLNDADRCLVEVLWWARCCMPAHEALAGLSIVSCF